MYDYKTVCQQTKVVKTDTIDTTIQPCKMQNCSLVAKLYVYLPLCFQSTYKHCLNGIEKYITYNWDDIEPHYLIVTKTVKLKFLYTANSLQHFGEQSAEVLPK